MPYALTRPLLTLLLWLITGLVYLGVGAEARGTIVETATFAATAGTLWWFGDRGQKREVGQCAVPEFGLATSARGC